MPTIQRMSRVFEARNLRPHAGDWNREPRIEGRNLRPHLSKPGRELVGHDVVAVFRSLPYRIRDGIGLGRRELGVGQRAGDGVRVPACPPIIAEDAATEGRQLRRRRRVDRPGARGGRRRAFCAARAARRGRPPRSSWGADGASATAGAAVAALRSRTAARRSQPLTTVGVEGRCRPHADPAPRRPSPRPGRSSPVSPPASPSAGVGLAEDTLTRTC